VNAVEIGGAQVLNFVAWTDVPGRGKDSAPGDGVFNYSLEANGPRIEAARLSGQASDGAVTGEG
jgi:hypothetical protein